MKFDSAVCASYVEMLVTHDEVERALDVLDNLPAYYREHTPKELIALRNEILGQRYTSSRYESTDNDSAVDPETAVAHFHHVLRGRILDAEVTRYNEAGLTPHIVEMGPGTYFFPQALNKLGKKFTYRDIALNAEAKRKAANIARTAEPAAEQPTIFLALEVIEHLPDPRDIVTECLQHCGGKLPHRIHLSTPLYTFDTEHDDWRTKDGLPHLRAYTPQEFYVAALSLFPGYSWEMSHDRIMSLRGQRKDCVDPIPLVVK